MRPRAGLWWALPLGLALLFGGCEWATGDAFQVSKALQTLSAAPYQSDGGQTELRLKFLSDTVEPLGAGRARAFSRVDVSGRYLGVETRCICVERVALVRIDGAWAFEGFPLPRLAAVGAALDARVAAYNAADAIAYRGLIDPDYRDEGQDAEALAARLSALFEGGNPLRQEITERVLRVEGQEAIVTESYRIKGVLGGREIDERGRARFTLAPGPAGWRFTSGLL